MAVGAIFAAPTSAGAAMIPVATTSDVSAVQCTLRDAIVAANTDAFTGGCPPGSASPAVDTIQFNLGIGSSIIAATPLPAIVGSVVIAGPGAGSLTVSGGDATSLFQVESSGSALIVGLTIAHAKCAFACGVLNLGDLKLSGVVVEQNVATATGGASIFPEAGGIYNAGTLLLSQSAVRDNSVIASGGSSQNGPAGGGIYNNSGASLTIRHSTISGNKALATAGAGGTANAIGGGISNAGELVIGRSTISGNSASGSGSASFNEGQGGGIQNANSAAVKVSIADSTISGNTASGSGGTSPASSGGGLTIYGSSFSVRNSTIAGNAAKTGANAFVSATVTFASTIVAQPLGGGLNCSSAVKVVSAGFNLEDAESCGFIQASDRSKTDPLLVPGGPTDNGGPTPTIALSSDSPAIDQGLAAVGETEDQRDLNRPVDLPAVPNAVGGDGTDIGAFEVQLPDPGPAPPAPTPPADSGPTPPPKSEPVGDTVAPKVTLKGLKKTTRKRSLKIRFASSEAGSSFRCKLDKKAFKPCRSPFGASGLALGPHVFTVIATDPAGNAGKAARKAFRVLAGK
ncbi:MAG TPA: choice-of-anchor Q domain-containing protein [Solirubrobacterales bacterium]|nr:choice-of-anchor Q domain-containing protein [Solirubrobacterales bacterium]